jgi:hypothetical protein
VTSKCKGAISSGVTVCSIAGLFVNAPRCVMTPSPRERQSLRIAA